MFRLSQRRLFSSARILAEASMYKIAIFIFIINNTCSLLCILNKIYLPLMTLYSNYF